MTAKLFSRAFSHFIPLLLIVVLFSCAEKKQFFSEKDPIMEHLVEAIENPKIDTYQIEYILRSTKEEPKTEIDYDEKIKSYLADRKNIHPNDQNYEQEYALAKKRFTESIKSSSNTVRKIVTKTKDFYLVDNLNFHTPPMSSPKWHIFQYYTEISEHDSKVCYQIHHNMKSITKRLEKVNLDSRLDDILYPENAVKTLYALYTGKELKGSMKEHTEAIDKVIEDKKIIYNVYMKIRNYEYKMQFILEDPEDPKIIHYISCDSSGKISRETKYNNYQAYEGHSIPTHASFFEYRNDGSIFNGYDYQLVDVKINDELDAPKSILDALWQLKGYSFSSYVVRDDPDSKYPPINSLKPTSYGNIGVNIYRSKLKDLIKPRLATKKTPS